MSNESRSVTITVTRNDGVTLSVVLSRRMFNHDRLFASYVDIVARRRVSDEERQRIRETAKPFFGWKSSNQQTSEP